MKSEQHRSESFSSTGVVKASLSTRSGDVRVRTHDQLDVRVELSVASAAHEHLLEQVVVAYDGRTNVLDVHAPTREGFENLKGLRDLKDLLKKRSWTELLSHDVDVLVTLPANSSVEVTTASGDTNLDGDLNHVKVTSASGDVVAGREIGSLDVRSASGDVTCVQVRDVLECRSASGDVHCSGSAIDSKVATASGDVVMTLTCAGNVVVRSVSGDVRIAVAGGLDVDVNGSSISGDVTSGILLDDVGDDPTSDNTVHITVSTVSGDLRLDRASSGERYVRS